MFAIFITSQFWAHSTEKEPFLFDALSKWRVLSFLNILLTPASVSENGPFGFPLLTVTSFWPWGQCGIFCLCAGVWTLQSVIHLTADTNCAWKDHFHLVLVYGHSRSLGFIESCGSLEQCSPWSCFGHLLHQFPCCNHFLSSSHSSCCVDERKKRDNLKETEYIWRLSLFGSMKSWLYWKRSKGRNLPKSCQFMQPAGTCNSERHKSTHHPVDTHNIYTCCQPLPKFTAPMRGTIYQM